MRTFFASVAAAALAIALVSPTLAATKHRHPVANDAARAYGAAVPAPGAFYAPNRDSVFFDNHVIGQDPDPNIRFQILRDPPENY
jgi:hypothetical protein